MNAQESEIFTRASSQQGLLVAKVSAGYLAVVRRYAADKVLKEMLL